MNYFFNKLTVLLVIGLTFMIALGFNEVTKYTRGVELRNRRALESWRERVKTEYKTQEECQEQNQVICNFEACDYVPAGKTLEEVCGPNLTKGWKPSLVPIPSFYRDLTEIKLTIRGTGTEQRLSVLPDDLVITYGTGDASASSKSIEPYQETFLTNKFILYEFDALAKRMTQPTATSTDTVRYSLTLTAGSVQGPPATSDISASCWSSRCPREFTDLKNDIIRMWGDPIPEK